MAYVDGFLPQKGNGGGGSGDIYVVTLPNAAAAEEDTTYIRTSDGSQWYIGSELVDAVPGSIVKSTISPPNHDWQGSQTSDPTDGSLIDPAAYFKSDTGVIRAKVNGSVDGIINRADLTPDTGLTWLDSATADPVNDAHAAFFDSSTGRFRIKPAGTTVDNSASISNASFHDSTSFSVLSPQTTEPTSTISTGQTELYYNTTNRIWRIRSHGSNSNNWVDAVAANIEFGLFGSTGNTMRWLGEGGSTHTVSGTSHIDTQGEVVDHLAAQSPPYNLGVRTYYYDVDSNTIKQVFSFTAAANQWAYSEILEVTGNANALFIGTGGLVGTAGFNTVSEVLDYFESNTFDTTKEYHFYDQDAVSIRHITSYEDPVEWEDSTIIAIISGNALFLGVGGEVGTVHINTDGEVVIYLDSNYDIDDDYYFYDGSDVENVDSYTATIDAYNRPIWEQLVGSGSGLSQAQVDNRIAPFARTGQDRNVKFVDSVPALADTEEDTIYIRRSDLSAWGREPVITPASITQVAFTGYFSTYNNRGTFNADADVSSPALNDIFFSLSRNSFRLYNGTTWIDRTIAQVSSSSHVGVGIGGVNPPVTIDTEEEVAAYFALNGFVSSNTYLIYLATLDEVREATGYTPSSTTYKVTQTYRDAAGNSYYDYADRACVAIADRDTASEVGLENDTGTVYDLHIEQNSDLIHLVDVDTGAAVRLSEDNTLWFGRVESFTKSGDVWIFKIDFYSRRSTFTVGENIHIEFGAIPHSRTSFFFGVNQTERVPDDFTTSYNVETNGIKSFSGNANENIHGGIAHTMLNSNDIINADIKHDAENTAIQIDESGHFHLRVKMFGNQHSEGHVRLRLYKVMSGTDDIALVTIAAWFKFPEETEDQQMVAEYVDAEQYINVVSGEQFILIMQDYNVTNPILAGYLEIERID